MLPLQMVIGPFGDITGVAIEETLITIAADVAEQPKLLVALTV